MEGFHANNNERQSSVESFEDWRALKMEAPKKAFVILRERGLNTNLESTQIDEVKLILAELPKIIEEYSYNEDGSVKNENRFIVEAIARFLKATDARREYLEAYAEALAEAA